MTSQALLPLTPRQRTAARAGTRAAPVCRDLLVILPTYNEEKSVGLVIEEVRRCLPNADVLVVDDGSSDRSAEVARQAGACVLSLPFNMGVGGAMRAGYKYAARRGYQVAVQVDADGQHDPGEVPGLLTALQHADVVVGARFAGVGDYAVRGPRRWAMRVLAWSVSRAARVVMTDVTSGMRACNATAIELFSRHYPVEYLGDTVESLLMATRAGLRVNQVPVRMRPRREGVASQTPLRASLYLGRAVLAMGVSSLRAREELVRPSVLVSSTA